MENARIVFSPKRSDVLFAIIGIDRFAFLDAMSVIVLIFLKLLYFRDKAIDIMRFSVMLKEDALIKIQVTKQQRLLTAAGLKD